MNRLTKISFNAKMKEAVERFAVKTGIDEALDLEDKKWENTRPSNAQFQLFPW